jgi:N-acetyl-1-D-myo-inositol-2-amino-2-deoxy-alpha-D-glucopyranoside deacetylase
MPDRLTFMAVHAHPDDESIGTGGALARYADEGLGTVLVTCTGGEVGEIAHPDLASPESLGAVRRRELEEAARILSVGRLHLLGYRDSGMAGTPDNDHPASFTQAPLDEAIGRLVALVRAERPQVLVSYDEEGFYGHPDHIRANRITVAAFTAAADPACYPRAGDPWQVSKLYYTAAPRSALKTFAQLMREAGIEPPFEMDGSAEPAWGTPDELVTTYLDVSAQVERKRQALLAHATQMGPEVFFARLPEQLFHLAFGQETFQLVQSLVPVPEQEEDLFAGLR